MNDPWHNIEIRRFVRLMCFILLLSGISSGYANSEFDFFEKKIRPVLIENCIECHGEKKQKGGLRLDFKQAWQIGGDSGSAIIPHKPQASLIVKAVEYKEKKLEMPPDGKLPESVIADIKKWIAQGALDPRDNHSIKLENKNEISIEEGKEFWSFKPVQVTPAQPDDEKGWAYNEVDKYLLQKMESHGVAPVEDTDRASLIRRLYYDLIGLPPTPFQIKSFLENESPDAYESLVDELLSSSHFGERWGRHWLDVVRFAQSSGGGRTLLFPEAWRYRDYVIEAFNNDKPYDRFISEQLAGDLMDSQSLHEKSGNMVATAFLLLGPTNYELQDKDILEMDIVDEQLDTMGKAFMGMTMGCARCHDHKFDPIPTKDYYALAGIFKNTKSVIHDNVSAWNVRNLPMDPKLEKKAKEDQQLIASLDKKIKSLKAKITKIEKNHNQIPSNALVFDSEVKGTKIKGSWKESTAIKGFVGSNYIFGGGGETELKSVTFQPTVKSAETYRIYLTYTPSSNRADKVPVHIRSHNKSSKKIINQQSNGKVSTNVDFLGEFECGPDLPCEIEITNEGAGDGVIVADAIFLVPHTDDVKKQIKTDLVDQTTLLKSELTELEQNLRNARAQATPYMKAMVVEEESKIQDIHVAIRGIVSNKGPLVERGFLQVACGNNTPDISDNSSGRLELARWLTQPEHPLTSRVMVNRIWSWVFGTGIVRSLDNFGAMGEEPSHPELLDYLANRYIELNWSTKQLIKELVTSRAYRLSSQIGNNQKAKDPDNRLFWHVPRKRLDAEAIRDTILHLAENLDLEFGGSNLKAGTKIEYGYVFESNRRSVYMPVFRNTLPEIFETFDFADPNMQNGKRNVSAVAPQALLMMNSPFVHKNAELAARHHIRTRNKSHTSDELISEAYLKIVGRNPAPQELSLISDYLARFSGELPEEKIWTHIFLTLYQSVDFRYLN